jgi:hypothetical protein
MEKLPTILQSRRATLKIENKENQNFVLPPLNQNK